MSSASHLGYLSDRKGKRTNPFPTRILIAAVAFLAFASGSVLFGQLTGIGVQKHPMGAPVAIRDITILRGDGDTVVVSDAASGQRIGTYLQDGGGFVYGSLRALERMRTVDAASMAAPYRLIKWESGAISLSDTTNGQRFYLEAFGKDNAAAFAALLDTREGASQ